MLSSNLLRGAWLRPAYAAGAVGWAALLPVAAVVRADPGAGVVLHAASATVYLAGAVVCHQLPSRSFALAGVPFPVCARCTGIYSVAALAALCGLLPVGRWAPWTWVPSAGSLHRRTRLVAALAAAAPSAATLAYEYGTGLTPGNSIRWLAGAPLGALVSWLVAWPAGPQKQSE